MPLTKREALPIVFRCAKQYQKELVNHSLLFICMDKHKRTYALEVTFDVSNFLHLTGLRTRAQNISAGDFFQRCLDQRLSEDDFDFSDDGTTPFKLEVLPALVSKNLSANMIGDYNGRQPKLITDKLAGSVRGCMGFKRVSNGKRYVPNTVLKGRTDDFTHNPDRIIITYRKSLPDRDYSEIVYAAKKLRWEDISLPEGYKNLPLPNAAAKSLNT